MRQLSASTTIVDPADRKLPPAALIYDTRSNIWTTFFDDDDDDDGSTVVGGLVDDLAAYARRRGPSPNEDGDAEPNVWSPGDEPGGYEEDRRIGRFQYPAP